MVPTGGDTLAPLHADVSPVRRRARRPHLRRPGPPGPLTIARALPAGTRVASSQHAWLEAVVEHPDVGQLRADAHTRLLEVARALAWSADWGSRTTRPTWARLCDRTGLGRRTVARWLAWLRTAGLLGVVETGSTPELRPRALAGATEGNRAALYVLATPSAPFGANEAGSPVDETGTPSLVTEGDSPTHARGADEPSPLRGPDSRPATTGSSSWPWTAATTHGRARLGCAQRLQERVPALRPLSDRHLRHLLRPWLLAGWTAADIVWAIDHAPDGTEHTWTTDVRSPKGWLAHRLGLWTDAAGAPLRALSATTAETVARSRETQAAVRAESAARRNELDQERALVEQLRSAAAEVWDQLVALVTRRLGRRRPGPMSEALARSAVIAALPMPWEEASTEQLGTALDVALVAAGAA